jgi:hypothetical protein
VGHFLVQTDAQMPNAIYSESVAIPDSSVQDHADQEARATKPTYRASTANKFAIGFAIYAAIRILVFCLAFPPTNGTDEKFHLMSVRMYGAGHLPGRDLPRMDPDFAKTLLLYWSPEFSQLDTNPNPVDASPLSMMTPQERKSALAHGLYKDEVELWLTQHSRRPNYQAQGPPLYYVVAGAWLDLGRTLGIRDWDQVYWIRLLNPMFYGLFVWISYCFVRKVYPEDKFLCLAVPGLLAVFPQDVFFGLSRDVLSPVMCAGALLAMAHAIVDKKEQYRSLLLASFLVGLTFLVEVSNFVLYGALAACLWMWVRDSDAGRRLNILVVTSSAILALALPFLWMSRNLLVIGDLSGSRVKMRALDWTMKPVTELFHHPLFSGHGLSYFLVELTRRFWRGEYVWHRMPMRSFPADAFYLLSTALLMLVFVMGLTRGWKARSGAQRFAGAQSLFLVVVSVLFLALISLPFDFNACPYPSRLYPYFVSGRIICGALLPFSLIYASGLEMVTNLFRKWVPPVVVLACLMLFITFSEIRVRGVVFSSPYNFFALSGSRQ